MVKTLDHLAPSARDAAIKSLRKTIKNAKGELDRKPEDGALLTKDGREAAERNKAEATLVLEMAGIPIEPPT